MENIEDPDRNLAILLQYELDSEYSRYEQNRYVKNSSEDNHASPDDYLNSSKGIIDPNWELIDPTPNIINLFVAFNTKYFWDKLKTVCVVWSKRMMACAGICSYEGGGGLCKIALSEPLLKLRPRKDLVETLLHEMIHAFLFVTDNNRDRDGHGPEFHKHMNRINESAGTKISVYHSFHDEVRLYQQHWWRCNGPCQHRHPFYGMVRRSQNRAPGPNDRWYADHERTCGGTFIKIKEPEKKPTAKEKAVAQSKANLGDIRIFLNTSGSPSQSNSSTSKPSINNGINVIHGFHDLNKTGGPSQSSNKINNNNNSTNKKSTTNIVGFNDLKISRVGNTGLKNSSSTIVVTKISDKTPKKTVSNTSSIPTTRDTKSMINYDLVRNHWANKIVNKQPPKRASNENNGATPPKKLKISCPVCSKEFSEIELNDHIDVCLKSSKSIDICKYCGDKFPSCHLNTHFNICPQKNNNSGFHICPICHENIIVGNLEEHVDRCLENESDNDVEEVEMKQCVICTKFLLVKDYDAHLKECIVVDLEETFNEDFEYVKCSTCGTEMDSDVYKLHQNVCIPVETKHCHMCKSDIRGDIFADHLANCFDKMMAGYSVDTLPSTSKNTTDSDESLEIVPCLVCNKPIARLKLEQHLEDCLNNTIEHINEFDEEFNEDGKSDDKSAHNGSSNMYNCPVCLKLLNDKDMNVHLDVCLTEI